MKKLYYLHNGRSALNYALDNVNFKKNDEILYPEYSCDVLFQYNKRKQFNYKFYKTKDNFFLSPKFLKKEITINTKIIIVINFFGIKQNIKTLYRYCKKKNILLFIDDCHTFYDLNSSSDYDCDVKFLSVSKIFNQLNSGGILQINNESIILKNKLKTKKNNIDFLIKIKKNLKKTHLYEKYKFLKNRPLFEDENFFKSTYNVKNYLLNNVNISIINRIDVKKENRCRIKNYRFWKQICKKFELKPLLDIKNIKHGCPLYFPAITKSHKHSVKMYEYGWVNNVEIVSWPTLHYTQRINKKLIDQWKKIIYFPMEKDYSNRKDLL